MAFQHPIRDNTIQLIQLACKEMIYATNFDESIVPGKRGNEFPGLGNISKLVVAAVNKQFRLVTLRQIRKIRIVDRNSQTSQLRHPLVRASNAQPYPGAEAKSGDQERQSGISGGQEIQSRLNVPHFSATVIVNASAQSRSPKIKSQDRKAQRGERFGRLIHDFVVHRSAKKRMGMANQCRYHRLRRGARSPINGLQPPGWSVQRQIE